MSNPTTLYTLISLDDKNDPRVEEFDMLSALKIRMRGIPANDPQYKLLANGRLVAWDWSEPELNINGIEVGGTPTPAKKERARRRTKAEMAADALAKADAKKAKANGSTAVAS